MKYARVLNVLYQQSNLKFDNEEHSRKNPGVPLCTMYTQRTTANRGVIAPVRPSDSRLRPFAGARRGSSGAPPPARRPGPVSSISRGPVICFGIQPIKRSLLTALQPDFIAEKDKDGRRGEKKKYKTSCTWCSSGALQQRDAKKSQRCIQRLTAATLLKI